MKRTQLKFGEQRSVYADVPRATFVMEGYYATATLCNVLVRSSIWFECLPVCDNKFEIDVKREDTSNVMNLIGMVWETAPELRERKI